MYIYIYIPTYIPIIYYIYDIRTTPVTSDPSSRASFELHRNIDGLHTKLLYRRLSQGKEKFDPLIDGKTSDKTTTLVGGFKW